jgi:hypothetical protein
MDARGWSYQMRFGVDLEEPEQPALAHPEIGGQTPDGQPVQAVHGRHLGGAAQDRGARLLVPWPSRHDHPSIVRTFVRVGSRPGLLRAVSGSRLSIENDLCRVYAGQ